MKVLEVGDYFVKEYINGRGRVIGKVISFDENRKDMIHAEIYYSNTYYLQVSNHGKLTEDFNCKHLYKFKRLEDTWVCLI